MRINVRVSLDSYDYAHPSTKECQVYVELEDVARASYLLPADRFDALRDAEWGEVLDAAHEYFEGSGWVSDSGSTGARAAVRAWLAVDENRDLMNEAWFQDRAQKDPVSRSLLADKARLTTELERLREWAAAREKRDEEILGVLGRVDIRDSAEAWDLGMSVLTHLDGPPVRSSREERDEGLRALISQLRAEVERLTALVAAMHAASVGETRPPLLGLVEDVAITRGSFLAQSHRADILDGIARGLQARVAELDQLPEKLRLSERAVREMHDGINRIASEADQRQINGFNLALERIRAVARDVWTPSDLLALLDELKGAPVAEPEAAQAPAEVTVYRAWYEPDALSLGLYTTEKAAQAHCDELLRRENAGRSWDWAPDDEGDLVQVFVSKLADRPEQTTGYIVTPVTVAAEYDAEADE
ncbi:MAG: hypothetical protein JWP40_1315 [Blastococcus sp.]|nr:hypothetical protein [Blastococcus sp.]